MRFLSGHHRLEAIRDESERVLLNLRALVISHKSLEDFESKGGEVATVNCFSEDLASCSKTWLPLIFNKLLDKLREVGGNYKVILEGGY